MSQYPSCCMAIHCGNILCTGCPNRPLLAARHRAGLRGGVLDSWKRLALCLKQ